MSFWLEYLQFRGYIFVFHPSTAPDAAPDAARSAASAAVPDAITAAPPAPPLQIRLR